jgi:hypothetical protein
MPAQTSNQRHGFMICSFRRDREALANYFFNSLTLLLVTWFFSFPFHFDRAIGKALMSFRGLTKPTYPLVACPNEG